MKGEVMKIVVIGGTGLVGSKVVETLKQKAHEAIAAAPNTGVNTITGEGLKEAMAGAQVVIDLANSPSFEDKAVLEFFETSGRNLLAAEAAAGVRHHIALFIVGTDRSDNGYFRAKVAQEKLIETSGIPYTIIRSTQFLEFLGGIAASSADGNMVRLSPGMFQPIAADDVAPIVAKVALAAPQNGSVEIAGPERAPFNEIVARYLKADRAARRGAHTKCEPAFPCADSAHFEAFRFPHQTGSCVESHIVMWQKSSQDPRYRFDNTWIFRWYVGWRPRRDSNPRPQD
jgi:uncharacterized protein YbjT (DUF2867 family)